MIKPCLSKKDKKMNRIINIISLVGALVLLCSCTSKEKRLKHILTGDSIAYWNYEWPRDRAEYSGATFSFDKEGNVKQYSFNKIKNDRVLFTDYGIVPDKKWRISGDTVLRFNYLDIPFKVIKYSKDTIFLKDLDNENTMLIRVKGDLNIKEPNPEPDNGLMRL